MTQGGEPRGSMQEETTELPGAGLGHRLLGICWVKRLLDTTGNGFNSSQHTVQISLYGLITGLVKTLYADLLSVTYHLKKFKRIVNTGLQT